ncbi:MAG: TolC family protein [Chlorobium sp.]|jgi:outer membrane protein TolC|nr:TolC family protein [Chlorobium sp.]
MESVQLTEKAYIDLVLTQNDAVRQQKLESLISKEGIKNAQSIFEPKLVIETMKEYGFEQNDTEAEAQRQFKTEYEFDDVTYSTAIKGLLPSGAQYRLFYDMRDPSNSLQPDDKYGREWTARTGIELTQPLLKNFGFSANKAAIDIAEKDFDISTQRFSRTQMTTAYQALVSYAALQQAQQAANMEKEMLDMENERIELMGSLAEEGRVTAALMHLTKSQAMRREARVSATLKQLRKATAEVRRLLIGADGSRMVNVVAIDATAPLAAPSGLETEQLATIVKQRPELKEASLASQQEEKRLEYAKNQSLYELNLVLKAGKSGLGENFSGANDELDSVHDFWTVGAVFTAPLGNSEAESKEAAASLRSQKAQQKARSLELLMQDEIVAAYDNVKQSYLEAEHFQQAVKSLEAAHRENEIRFKEGKMNRLDLLASQLELIEGRRLLSEKVYENRRASLEVKLAEGRILDVHRQ